MTDIAPELLDLVKEEFQKAYEHSSKIKTLLETIGKGRGTYKEANQYAIEVGEILAKVFRENISAEILPDNRMYFNIAKRVIREPLANNHKLVSELCAEVQTTLNKQNNLGLKGIVPKLNEDRIKNLIDIVSDSENFDDVKSYLDEPVVNFTQAVVDDAIKENAEFQHKSGLSPKIRRISTGHCCEWCEKLAGTYDYDKVSPEVFKRHRFCRCTVEFINNGKKQNVHTKKDTSRESRIQQIKDLEELDKEKGRIRKQTIQKEQKQKKKAKQEPKLEAMSLAQLRKEAEKVAIQYYKSGKSGINFGNNSVEHVAKTLAQQGSRTSLIKDIRSMKKAMK